MSEKVEKLLFDKQYYDKFINLKTEDLIICNLFCSIDFFNRVFEFLQPELFVNISQTHQVIISMIQDFVKIKKLKPKKFKQFISYIEEVSNFSEKDIELLTEYKKQFITPFMLVYLKFPTLNIPDIQDIFFDYCTDKQSFLNQVEIWIKQRLLENAILKSVDVLEKTKTSDGFDKIESVITDALRVSFDMNIGLKYLEDVDDRISRYKERMKFMKIKGENEHYNKVFGGGLLNKSLYIVIAPPNYGKSAFLSSLSCDLLRDNKKVLYISGEMSEDQIARRIDSNLLSIPIFELTESVDEQQFKSKFIKFKEKIKDGNLIIKEYPTGTTSTNQINSYLDDLIVKYGFKPDVIIVDYMNLFLSSRVGRNSVNSYEYIKYITEELRSIAIERDCIVFTATQINREGTKKKNIAELKETDVADGFSAIFTADWVGALFRDNNISVDDEGFERIMALKVLKTRFASNVGFVYKINADFKYMRLTISKDGFFGDSENEEQQVEKPKITKKKTINTSGIVTECDSEEDEEDILD